MVKKRTIITRDREIYNKLNMLFFNSDVVLKDVSKYQISRILENINKHSTCIDMEEIGEYFLLKKVGPLNFQVYLNNKGK